MLLTLPGDVTVTVHFGLPAEVPLLVTLKPILMVDELSARRPTFVTEYDGPLACWGLRESTSRRRTPLRRYFYEEGCLIKPDAPRQPITTADFRYRSSFGGRGTRKSYLIRYLSSPQHSVF
jgi:hypothetical protein